jgi:hypothetical protein
MAVSREILVGLLVGWIGEKLVPSSILLIQYQNQYNTVQYSPPISQLWSKGKSRRTIGRKNKKHKQNLFSTRPGPDDHTHDLLHYNHHSTNFTTYHPPK